MTRSTTQKLTMGPVLFNWQPETWRDFYFRIADEAPVDIVYVGEAVCSKRTPFFTPLIPEVVERLQSAGKEVVLSTMALIMSPRELGEVRDITHADNAMDGVMIEANDMSAASLLAGRPHVVGPMVNVYNEGTLAYLARNGAVRVGLPFELSKSSIKAMADGVDVDLEVQVFGRLPLAVSARCYHARTHKLTKDNCQYVCNQDPDGMDLETADGEPFLAVNGIQTMSYTYGNLIGELDQLKDMGITHFRISPHTGDMVEVARVYCDVMQGRLSVEDAAPRLDAQVGGMPFSNGFFYGEEGVHLKGRLAAVLGDELAE